MGHSYLGIHSLRENSFISSYSVVTPPLLSENNALDYLEPHLQFPASHPQLSPQLQFELPQWLSTGTWMDYTRVLVKM